MRTVWLLAAAASLSACVTIEEHRLFIDPIIDPSDPVTDARGETPADVTYADLIEETGGEAGVFGGTLLAFGGHFSMDMSSDSASLHRYAPFEGTPLWRDARRFALPSPAGAVSVVRLETTVDAPRAPLVVYCPGTASTIDTTALMSAYKVGAYAGDLLLFDYPGYGQSAGTRSVASVEAAVDALAAHLDRPDSRPLVLWGYSLGGFACAELAARTRPDALILDSPVRNAREGVGFFVPDWLRPLARPLLRFDPALERFDVVRSLAGTDVPVLVIGAERDGVLPEAGARSLHEALRAAGHDAAYVLAEGEGHFGPRRTSPVIEVVNALLGAPRGTDPFVPRTPF